jgi:hypothetical protein
MLNNFANGLMRFSGVVMFFSGMAMLAYAVVGGYYHYSPLWHAVAWGFAGWVLFFSGMNLLEQYKPQAAPALPPQPERPMPQPVSPYSSWAGNATRPPPRRAHNPFDHQPLDD